MSKLVSGIGIGVSLLTAAIFGVILNESASKMSYANEVWQWISVGVIVASIIAFGVCAFFFSRKP